jgi:Tfp pilus assembly protein PilX
MPDGVRNSGWNRRFKSHDKANKRLMTGAEAAEKDAEKREQAAEHAPKAPTKERTEDSAKERTKGITKEMPF